MNKQQLIQVFPAGGRIEQEIPVTNIVSTSQENVLRASAVLPPANLEKAILIYRIIDGEQEEYRAIPAKCPHQGADLSDDQLKPDGNVYCHLHKRPICVFSEYNYAFNVVKRGESFMIVP